MIAINALPVLPYKTFAGKQSNGGTEMAYSDWLLSLWGGKEGDDNPFADLRQRIDSLSADFDHGLLSRPPNRRAQWRETKKIEVRQAGFVSLPPKPRAISIRHVRRRVGTVESISGEDGAPSMLYLFVFTQFRTQNRFPFLLELL